MAIKIKKSSINNKKWLNKNIYVRIKTRKQKGVSQMKKNRGIQKLAILALLGVFMFSNIIPYQQFIQKNKQLEIRVQSQKKSNGLDVGKAD